MDLKGKIALVTGAGRGLGRAHALALAAAGAKVIVNDLGSSGSGEGDDSGPAHSVVAEIINNGGEAIADTRSVSDWIIAHQIVEEVIEKFGTIDILINNAGISRPGVLGDLTEVDWELQNAVNAKGPIAMMNALARHWKKEGPKKGRAIINTASPAAPHPLSPIGIYSATKAAILAFTVIASQELACLGVRVNAIAPIARTRLVEMSAELLEMMTADADFDRYLPEHVAELVVYLASDNCRFTGRLFGAEGDDIFIFNEWSAEGHANNCRVKWTADALTNALESFPIQNSRWVLFPGGRLSLSTPSDQTLSELANV